MKQDRYDWRAFVWGLSVILMILATMQYFLSPLGITRISIISLAISSSLIPLLATLFVRLYALLSKKTLLSPRWISLLYTYIIAYVFGLLALIHSTEAYWIAVITLMMIVSICQLLAIKTKELSK